MREWFDEWFGWEYANEGDHVHGSFGLGWVVVGIGFAIGLVFGLGVLAGRAL